MEWSLGQAIYVSSFGVVVTVGLGLIVWSWFRPGKPILEGKQIKSIYVKMGGEWVEFVRRDYDGT